MYIYLKIYFCLFVNIISFDNIVRAHIHTLHFVICIFCNSQCAIQIRNSSKLELHSMQTIRNGLLRTNHPMLIQ